MPDITKGFTFSGSPATASVEQVHALVDAAVINPGAIDSNKLASNAVSDSTKIADNAVSAPKLGVGPFFVEAVLGTADALTIDLTETVTIYNDGDVFCFKALYTNATTTPTLQVDAGPAQIIVCAGSPLKAGDIQAGSYYTVRSNASTFQLLSPRSSGNLEVNTVTGTNDLAVTLASSYAVPDYYDGLLLSFKPVADNTGAVNLNVGALGDKDLFKNLDEELDAGDLLTGQVVIVVYDGTSFQLVSHQDLAKVAVVTPDFATDSFLFIEEVENDAGVITGGNIKQAPITSLTPLVVALLSDTKAQGTHGGENNPDNTWTNHDLQTKDSDSGNLVAISNTGLGPGFVLVAGTYLLDVHMTAHYNGNGEGWRVRLYNVTGPGEVTTAKSVNVYTENSGSVISLSGIVSSNGTDEFVIQHYVERGSNGNDLGNALDTAGESEVYLQVRLTKIS